MIHDEDKDLMRRKSLTDQCNDTLAGGMPPLTNSSNQIRGQWIKLVACWDIFYAFCHLLILPDLGPNRLLRLSAGGTCI